MTGKINENQFKTVVESGSPVTIFEIEDIERIMQRKTLFIRQQPEDEDYDVDFNEKMLNLLGYVFCQLEVASTNFGSTTRSQITNWTRLVGRLQLHIRPTQ